MKLHNFYLFSYNKISTCLAIYIGFFLNIPVYLQRHDFTSLNNIGIAALEVLTVIVSIFWLLKLFSFLGSVCYKLLASFILIISAAASYYMIFFNIVIGYGAVASVFTPDFDLYSEIIGYRLFGWSVLVSIIPLWFILRASLQSPLSGWVKKSVLFMLPILITWSFLFFSNYYQKQNEKLTTVDLPSYGGVWAHSYLPVNWISALGLFSYTQLEEHNNEDRLLNPAEQFTYIAPQNVNQLYIIFIIGESARWDHMGIFGYSRQTTPYLSKEKNLVGLKGISCDTATRLSLRCMFVREGGTEKNVQHTLKEHNIFAVLSTLGFSSELFAMQSEVSFYKYVGANNYVIRENIAAENQNNRVDDILLIKQLQNSLAKYPTGKHLVVLHTKGSHYLYSQRYPREFAKYQPECMGIDDSCKKSELINAYDNSILYTDFFLKNVFDQLRDKKALVFYASDHGESIDDNSHFHATPVAVAPKEQRRVPLLVWGSDSLLADSQYQPLFRALKNKSQQIGRHEALFDSILGCAGYQSPDGGIVTKNNWCGE